MKTVTTAGIHQSVFNNRASSRVSKKQDETLRTDCVWDPARPQPR